VNPPEDKTPDFEELAGDAGQSEQKQPEEATAPESEPSEGAGPDLDFAMADTPSAPLEPLAGLGEPAETPEQAAAEPADSGQSALGEPAADLAQPSEEAFGEPAEQAAEEAAEQVGAEAAGAAAEAGEELPDFMKTAAEGEEKQEEEQEPEEEESKEGLLAKLAQANPYTVLLGIALAALTLGVICLLLELKAYNFDWKAEGARSQLPAPVRYETPSMTTAAAWPDCVQFTETA